MPSATNMSDHPLPEDSIVERLQQERDEAQSAVQAWVHVAEGLEAHIRDRMAMEDPASPATYLSILQGDVADVAKRSEQICAARWSEYRRHQATIQSLTARLDEAREAGDELADKLWVLRCDSRDEPSRQAAERAVGQWSATLSNLNTGR